MLDTITRLENPQEQCESAGFSPKQTGASAPSKLELALLIAKTGTRVFPLAINGKEPAISGNWRVVATNDPAKIDRLWREPLFGAELDFNIGIALDKNTLVVDEDVRDGKQGAISKAALEASHGPFPPTGTVATASGGRHYYYSVVGNSDMFPKQLAPDIDLKGYGGYVVGPGSTIDGATYTVTETGQARAPSWILERAGTTRKSVAESKSSNKDAVSELDTPQNVERAIQYLQNAPDHGTYLRACYLKDLGVSEDVALDLMLGHWPGADTRDAEHIAFRVANAYRYGQNAPGSRSPEAEFEAVKGADLDRSRSDWPSPTPLVPFDPAALRPRRWIVPEILARGFVAGLTSPGGMGKTSYTLALLASVASGCSDPIGQKVIERTSCWFWCQEDDLEELHRRLVAVMQVHGMDFADFVKDGKPMLHMDSGTEKPLLLAHRRSDGKLTHTKQVDQIIRHIREQEIGVFVFDPLVEFHEANENDNAEMKTVIAAARRIAIEADCAVLAVAHTRKPTEANSEGFVGTLDSTRGASSQAFAMRLGCTLFTMSEKDAKRYGVSDSDRRLYARLDTGAKANLTLPAERPQWFKRESVTIANGEAVGALVPVDLELREDPKELARASLIQDVLDCMNRDKIPVTDLARTLCQLPMRADSQPRALEMAIKRTFAEPVEQAGYSIRITNAGRRVVLERRRSCNSNNATDLNATVAELKKSEQSQ